MTKIFKEHNNFLIILALLSGLGWIWISADRDNTSTRGHIPAPRKGFLAPDFELISLDAKPFQLDNLRGKPVVLNFWASWCLPCRAEMPAIERAFQQNEQDLIVLGINATNQDNQVEVSGFVNELGLTFPILLDQQGEVMALYRVSALPTTFFIDTDGIIQEMVIGGPMAEALLTSRMANLIQGR